MTFPGLSAFRAILTAAIATTAIFGLPIFATAQQVDMNIVDQPGYQPTPEEEQLSGALRKAGGVFPDQ